MDSGTLEELTQAIADAGLIAEGERVSIAPLSGGVSCDVYLVEGRRNPPMVVKRALPKLRVEADWRAPVERAESEVAWIRLVGEIDSRLVPHVIAQDRERHLFVMRYLPKESFPVWKSELAAGIVDVGFATSVGDWLARIHARTAHSPELAERFANQAQFRALRLDAYLLEAARANPDCAPVLQSLVDGVDRARIALMHGDISPKNILHGPGAPVFLDAETTCYGDPAFDLAFCLNHLLLKCVWHREHAARYANAFAALKNAYLARVEWEDRSATEARTVPLLAGLLLARIDGKSPVEYIADESKRAFVRARAKSYLRSSPTSLDSMSSDWTDAVDRSLEP